MRFNEYKKMRKRNDYMNIVYLLFGHKNTKKILLSMYKDYSGIREEIENWIKENQHDFDDFSIETWRVR